MAEDDTDELTVAGSPAPLVKPDAKKDRAYLIVLAGTAVGEMYGVGKELTIGRGSEAEVRVLGEGVSRRHAMIVSASTGITIEDLGSTNGTFVNGEKVVGRRLLNDGDKVQVGSTTILKFSYHDELEEGFQRQLYASALRDGLTKIYNKKYFMERLGTEFAYTARHGSPLSLLMFDLDHFKKVNDTHGHLVGDHVLTTLAAAIDASIRGEDLFARYGGEEFVILSRGIDSASSKLFATRLRDVLVRTDFTYRGLPLRVTVSMGIATIPDPTITSPEQLIEAADQALYEAKRQGRDRIVARTVVTTPGKK